MAEKKVRIGSEVDATGARKGFDDIKRAGEEMADDVKKSGTEAGQGLDNGVGQGAENAKKRINKANSALNQSIARQTGALQRQLAQIASGSARGTRAYFEEYAKLRGADIEKLEKNLKQLEAVENRVNHAIKTTTKNTEVAGYAVSNLAAQFQDVAVSAQGGLSPLTIALQQGTQISAVMGQAGAAGAMRMLGAAFASVISPVSLATIGVTAFIAIGIQWIASLFEAEEGVKTLDDRVNAFNETLGELKANTIDSKDSMEQLEEKYGVVNKRVLDLIGSIQKYNKLELKQNLEELITGFVGDVQDKFGAGALGFTIDLDFARGPQAKARQQLVEELQITEQEARKLEKAFIALSQAKGLEGQEASLQNVRNVLLEMTSNEPNENLREMNKSLAEILLRFIEYRKAIDSASSGDKKLTKEMEAYVKLSDSVAENAFSNNQLYDALSNTTKAMGDADYQTGIFTRQIELNNAAKKAGKQITEELSNAHLEMATREAEAAKRVADAKEKLDKGPELKFFEAMQKGAEEWVKKYEDSGKAVKDAIVGAFDSAADSITEFVMTGEADIKRFTQSVLSEFVKIAVRAAVIRPFVSSFFGDAGGASAGSVASARGNAFAGGQVQAFANGGVFGSPVTFPMAGGKTGLMAEAGPEAIMPLGRDSKGRLGVRAQGGQNVKIDFQLVNNSSQPLQRQSQQAFYDEDMKSFVVRTVIEDYNQGGVTRNLIGER